MVRVYCDRCKKQMPKYYDFFELVENQKEGAYMVDVRRLEKKDPSYYPSIDLCLCIKCREQLVDIVKNFMMNDKKRWAISAPIRSY